MAYLGQCIYTKYSNQEQLYRLAFHANTLGQTLLSQHIEGTIQKKGSCNLSILKEILLDHVVF